MPFSISAMSKVPIETLPVELRIKIYELGDISTISTGYEFPWARTILMSGILNDKDAIEIAAIQGEEPEKIMCSYIALSGNIPMMKWARSDRSSRKDDETAMEPSMMRSRLTPFPWSKWTCYHAAKFGHFQLLKWLHEQGCPWDQLTFGTASQIGNIKMLEWLYQNKCPWDSSIWIAAATAEPVNWDVMKWLYEKKLPWDDITFSFALQIGNLDVVEWLIERGCPSDDRSVLGVAAGTGNLTMVKWLVDRGYRKNEYACRCAAENGHLEILKWLHEQRCPWDSRTCDSAARKGHVEILQWLREQGHQESLEDEDSSDSDHYMDEDDDEDDFGEEDD